MSDALIDARELSRLRWRCRRGLLENDLFVERFFAGHPSVTVHQAAGLAALMELPDNDLLDLLLRRREPEGALARDEVIEVLRLLRTPGTEYARAAQTSPD
ncbi:FAD assembly factor SdhE [Piscinibacter defluvii]|uniref:FAD assembly factor SdhE n=1 Tax=Piscinibacter defluvii TaxID=1796922 RepID=UPI000FDE6107|nr:succinate dehydrogenase assembly factor 2 [Piscinibacter defluvii]